MIFNVTIFAQHSLTKSSANKIPLYIKGFNQAKELYEGKEVDVWYKNPKTGEFFPKLNWHGGTAFIVIHNKHYYLITAKHVATSLSKQAFVIGKKDNNKTISIPLSTICDATKGAKWFCHETADIAAHPFGFNVLDNPAFCFLLESTFFPTNQTLSVMKSVYIHGFPLGIGTQYGEFLPVAQTTHIASWMTSINKPNFSPSQKYILIDQPITQGYSGAPVFAEVPTSKIIINPNYSPPSTLIGVAVATLNDSTGGKIGMVVPVKYLRELLSSTAIKEYEINNPIK